MEEELDSHLNFDDPRTRIAFTYFFGQTLSMSRDKAFFYNASADGARIEIWINFERVNSIDFIKRHVTEAIDKLWREYRDSGEHERKTIKMADYDKILEVGDLREKNPDMTFQEIANLVFPLDKASPESAEKRAQQHYSRYKKLTNGGWKDFRSV